MCKTQHEIAGIETICIINESGDKEWRLNGQLHREDGPAYESFSGTKHWFLNGERHREDGPAVEWANGDKEWWLNGKRHREDHRADGPACEWYNGSKAWYYQDKKIDCKDNQEFLKIIKLISFM